MPSLSSDVQQLQNQRHADVLAVLHLLEVAGTVILIHRHGDLIDTGQGMQDPQVRLGVFQLLRGEDVAVLQAQIVLLVEKPLPLDTGHIEDIQLRHHLIQRGRLDVGDVPALDVLLLDVAGQLQLLRGDEYEADAGIAAHGGHQRVDGAAEFQVAAQADGQIVEAALLPVDGQQIRQGLGGVVVATVSGVDDGYQRVAGGHQRSTLLGVAHGDDIAVTADGADGVGHALTLGGGGAAGGGEAQHLPAQTQHGALEAETGAGGGLEEQGGQYFAVALVGIGGGMVDDVAGGAHQIHDLLRGQLQNVNEMVHTVHSPFLIQFSSEGSSRKASSRATSPCMMYPCWTPT